MAKNKDFQLKEDPSIQIFKICLIIVSVTLSIIGLLLLSNTPVAGVILLLLGGAIGILPFSIIEYLKFGKIQKMEEKFPVFIRNFAEIKKSGMTFPQALELSTKTDYGPLTKELQKTANQVSWGIPFTKAVDRLAERLKESKAISQALRVINEAFSSGGDIAQIMESLSLNIGLIRETYKERKSTLSQQSVIMYFVFIAFLFIVVALYKILIPLITGSGIGTMLGGGSDSSSVDYCTFVPSVCNLGTGFGFETGPGLYFQTLFFLMSIVQAVCIGLLTGLITDNKVTAGIKHIAIMLVCVFITFMVVL